MAASQERASAPAAVQVGGAGLVQLMLVTIAACADPGPYVSTVTPAACRSSLAPAARDMTWPLSTTPPGKTRKK